MWHNAEMEKQRLNVKLAKKEHQMKHAQKLMEQEQKMRAQAEAERDNLQKQLQGIKDLLLADSGKTLNNDTLKRIRQIDMSTFGSSLFV